MSFTRMLKGSTAERKHHVSCRIFKKSLRLLLLSSILKLMLQGPLSHFFLASEPRVTEVIVIRFYSKGSPKNLEVSLCPESSGSHSTCNDDSQVLKMTDNTLRASHTLCVARSCYDFDIIFPILQIKKLNFRWNQCLH